MIREMGKTHGKVTIINQMIWIKLSNDGKKK
jgi:hypothetical protein